MFELCHTQFLRRVDLLQLLIFGDELRYESTKVERQKDSLYNQSDLEALVPFFSSLISFNFLQGEIVFNAYNQS